SVAGVAAAGGQGQGHRQGQGQGEQSSCHVFVPLFHKIFAKRNAMNLRPWQTKQTARSPADVCPSTMTALHRGSGPVTVRRIFCGSPGGGSLGAHPSTFGGDAFPGPAFAQAVSATHRSRASIIAFQFGTYVTIGAQPLSRENSPRFPYFSRRPLAYLTRRRAFYQRPGKAFLTHILQEKD